ncbi:activator-dependent family glycosyltransferase [Amycolatopsis sp. YIM 10]|uniref:activator-dependent family glycosyltransferase n=1 Tax=Amycolatopsis sp. YIM 10 TaxID=2653857 RepID=UPI00129014E2|nr:activator-dependent family glycosyltransferase [Amycolatopsis sp. YIM 10]QFU89740.1 Desosaminyl transferase EryCIII precursor [Amycolatopsis sp. YIM 10]
MRILFATYPEKTHFLAMVPLAWALRAAGHEVRVASQPRLVDTITRAGLTAVPVGTDHGMDAVTKRFLAPEFAARHPALYAKVRWGRLPPFDLPEDPARLTWEALRDGQKEAVPGYRMANEPMVADLVAFARAWRPDLVFWEPVTYAAAIAARACGAAHARVLWSLDFFGRMRRHFLRLRRTRPEHDREDALGTWLAGLAGRYGVEFTEELLTGQFTVEQFPASLRMEVGLHSVPMRYVPYPGPAVIPGWLRHPPARPRVALTLGLSSAERFGGYSVSVRELLDGLAELDVEVVATVAESEQHKLTAVPPNARIVPFVPLPALLPTCSLVIHHAGFGTLCTTMLNAVPQLAIPEQEDALVSTLRVERRGAAVVRHVTELTGDFVREQARRLLAEPSFGAAAARLADEMLAMPTPAETVPELEKLAREHRAAQKIA